MKPWTMFAMKRAFTNSKIKHKMLSLISLLLALCFLVTYLSLHFVYLTYDEQLYAKSSQLLNSSSGKIEDELKRLDQLSYSLVTNLQLQSLLLLLEEPMPEIERYQIHSRITDRLVSYAGNEKYIYSIQLTDVMDRDYIAGHSSNASADKRRSILRESAKGEGGTRWIAPDEEDAHLILAREIRSYQYNAFALNRLGTLTIRIAFNDIAGNILADTELKNGQLQIMFGDRMIYPLAEHSGTAMSVAWDLESERQGYAIKPIDGRQYFVTRIQSKELGWTYYSLIPFDQVFTKIIMMKNILLVGFIVIVLVVFALAIKFVRSLTRPIEGLIGMMKQVQKGNFDPADLGNPDWTSPQMDEVGQLKRTFRMMMRQINELITENYTNQIAIKETQIKALQAQINPHFLYNTLESINWLAKSNSQPQISKMVESLGFLFRSSISLKETLITVEEELDIVMNYITIQKFRFEERLDFSMDVPTEVRNLLLPKLTLQPLIENSIYYALERMIEPCRIRLSSRREPGRCLLTVEDNGPGIEADLLERVRRGDAPARGIGIGIGNIKERIALAFGENYGVSIDSEPGRGTRVSVHIPDERNERHV